MRKEEGQNLYQSIDLPLGYHAEIFQNICAGPIRARDLKPLSEKKVLQYYLNTGIDPEPEFLNF
jgi:hypothetical protein